MSKNSLAESLSVQLFMTLLRAGAEAWGGDLGRQEGSNPRGWGAAEMQGASSALPGSQVPVALGDAHVGTGVPASSPEDTHCPGKP